VSNRSLQALSNLTSSAVLSMCCLGTNMFITSIIKAVIRKINHVYGNLVLFLVHKIHKTKNKADYDQIMQVLKRYRSRDDALANPYQEYKLYELNEVVNKFKPRSILEFGSGGSTCIFAQYVKGNNARLTSVDESEEWLEHTRSIVAETADDNSKICFIHADKVADCSSDPKSTSYDYNFAGQWDLVYVDGPSLRINNIRDKQVINHDIIRMILAGYRPQVILVDARQATVKYLAEHFSNLYDSKLSHLFDNNIKLGYQYHSIFVLKGEQQ
jgi:hypothetical protein